MNPAFKLNLIRAISVIMLLFSANIVALVVFASVAMSIGIIKGKEISLLSPLATYIILFGYASSIVLAKRICQNRFYENISYYYSVFVGIGFLWGLFLEYFVQHQANAKLGIPYGTLEAPSLVVLIIAYWQTKFRLISKSA